MEDDDELSPKDSKHEMWDDAKFGELDASFCYLVNKDMDILIYCPSDRTSKRFFIKGYQMNRIVRSFVDAGWKA